MKIGIDFDDVIVYTMMEWVRLWNLGHEDELLYKEVDNWNLGKTLEVSDVVILNYFNLIDYKIVTQVPDAVIGIKDLIEDGHEVSVLTKNPRRLDIRRWLDAHGLRDVPLMVGLKDKAEWAKDYNYDVLIDDRPETLVDATLLGIKTIRMQRPWNKGIQSARFSVRTWPGVLRTVRTIERLMSQPALASYDKRNALSNAMNLIDPVDTPLLRKLGSLNYEAPLPKIASVEPDGYVFVPDSLQDEEPKIRSIDYRYGLKDYEPTITNEKGGKQSDIGARFDLLPARAVARVAEVLDKGEKKYGKDNWRLLSVNEITNHTIGHLMNYLGRSQEEDLAHAACRALMALEMKLLELEAETIQPDDPGWGGT